MALVCPINFDTARLTREIKTTYSDVARNPTGDFHFHRGPEYAAALLGYDIDELRSLPAAATESFAGVGNPFLVAGLPVAGTVIDLGSGSGMDCHLAARQVGAEGTVVGIDMTDGMLEKARSAASAAGLSHLRFEKADIADLPLEAESVDVAISNGVINLAPDKRSVFSELYRVVRPGGRLQFADIVIGRELSDAARSDIDLWTG